MKAAIYARKSTEQTGVGDEAKSITRQIEHARAFAERKGWMVDDAHIYLDDGISGAEFIKRPGLARFMNALSEQPAFQILIMSEESRLGREQMQTGYLLSQIADAGVRIFYYLEDREAELDSATGKLLEQVRNFAAEMEREKARQRTADTMLRKAKAGHVTGGRVFGYENYEVRSRDGQRDHVERRVIEAEAGVVRRIFELCAQGHGKRRIAHVLNEEGAPAPQPRKDRPRGWSASSVQEILHRDLYRGWLVWNRTRKRDARGRKRPSARRPEDWIRVPVPHLRIVSDDLWAAAHERLEVSRQSYLRSTDGRLWGKPANGIESKYLLTGMAVCGPCGGALTVRSRSHGRQRKLFYHCLTNIVRGRTICPNDMITPLEDAEAAVRETFERHVLREDVVMAAVQEAAERLRPSAAAQVALRAELDNELAQVKTELARWTEAIAQGGNLPTLIQALKDGERRREQLERKLEGLEEISQVSQIDVAQMEHKLTTILAGWRDLLAKHTPQARQILRKLLDGRLAFAPREENGARYYEFAGKGALDPILKGELPAIINNSSDIKRWWPQRDSCGSGTGVALRDPRRGSASVGDIAPEGFPGNPRNGPTFPAVVLSINV
ncbi:MAG: recombinase family protein [Betaproteobacteria bacterium]|nr:recombinase family protein [Betaproteobacteria bacterium]